MGILIRFLFDGGGVSDMFIENSPPQNFGVERSLIKSGKPKLKWSTAVSNSTLKF
jgi:hypothetical protein